MLRKITRALATELGSLEWRGPRGLEAAEATAAVTLATLAALALHSDEPWWSAITAFMVTRAAPALAVSRGLMRIAGSAVGAVTALLVLRLFAYQSVPFLLCLFVISCIGLFGFVASRYSYAWLVGAVTACLVMLMSFDQPQSAFSTAVNRVIDVVIGTAASLIVCALSPLPPPAKAPAASPIDPPPLAFWRRDYGVELQRWLPGKGPLILHACRGGLAVMLMPALAEWIAPVSPVTVGVTVVMVMSIPTTTAILQSDTSAIVERAAHRLIGCLLGALVGLAALAFIGDNFLLWIALIPPGIWLCSQIQTGTTGVSYIGTQAMFAYLMSMVQGQGPPVTIAPASAALSASWAACRSCLSLR